MEEHSLCLFLIAATVSTTENQPCLFVVATVASIRPMLLTIHSCSDVVDSRYIPSRRVVSRLISCSLVK